MLVTEPEVLMVVVAVCVHRWEGGGGGSKSRSIMQWMLTGSSSAAENHSKLQKEGRVLGHAGKAKWLKNSLGQAD